MKKLRGRCVQRGMVVAAVIAVSWLIVGLALDASGTYIVGGVIGAMAAPLVLALIAHRNERR